MLHEIPVEKYGPQGEVMARQVKACVHCGFCLAACPTYKVLGEEMDSPRGRIYLMKEMLEGNVELDSAISFVDKCLGCQACVPACPSGVEYGELLIPFRAYAEQKRNRGVLGRLQRLMLRMVLPFPRRFRALAAVGRMARPMRGLLPAQAGTMLELLPAVSVAAPALPEVYPAKGERRARVAFLEGCVQRVIAPHINWATLRVLAENGVEVIIPPQQNCCGALAMHTGEADQARTLSRQNFRHFDLDVDAIITNAAGCGSGMKEYAVLFKGLPEEEAAAAFAARVQDVSTFLDELGLVPCRELAEPLKVAYHDACHLAHAQGIHAAPRRLLQAIPNLTLVDIPESETCCGSAGTYNIEQPEIAHSLGQRKVGNIVGTGAQAVATGNIGCITQIQSHLRGQGNRLPVYHTIELLDRSYQGGD